jgi:phosphatidylserine/phosphatidylglycerophosphate/cardiolipin synthase-like enzyme
MNRPPSAFVALAALLLGAFPCAAQTVSPSIEIVESFPVETGLDNPEIRNTADVWREMIRSARVSLDIEQFYISNQKGEPLEEILTEILGAGSRGVAVRVLADARMAKTYPESIARLGRGTNIAARTIDFGRVAGGVQHAKYFLVDGEEIFLGSQNFDWRALKHIHELGLRIRHAGLVAVYREIFELDWALAADPAARPALPTAGAHPREFLIARAPGDTVRISPTVSPLALLADTALWDETRIVELIDGATTELFCQFLSYSPVGRDRSFYGVLESALKRAALRGVRVSLLVSDWEKDRPAVDYLKSLACFPKVEVKFSEIPAWSGGYVPFGRVEHCKFIVADDRAFWLGTSNAEKSYFYTSRNIGAVVRSAGLTAQMRAIFLKSWNGPYASLVRPEAEYTPREHGER